MGAGVAPGPTRESAKEFGFDVVGRLLEAAFYAPDAVFVEQVAWPGSVDVVAAELSGRVEEVRWAIATLPGDTERTWFVSAPLTVEVAGFDSSAGTASVEVWVVTVFSRAGLGPPEARFVTQIAELRWSEGGWLLAGVELVPGPSVGLALEDVPVTASDLDAALSGHELRGGVGG